MWLHSLFCVRVKTTKNGKYPAPALKLLEPHFTSGGARKGVVSITTSDRESFESYQIHSCALSDTSTPTVGARGRHPQLCPHYNMCLEEILATMGENGEGKISWNFNRTTRTPRAIAEEEEDLGTGETLKVVWDLRIRRELEEPGWITCYTDGPGLDDKAARSYTRSCHGGFVEKTGSEYLGIKATHHDGELSTLLLEDGATPVYLPRFLLSPPSLPVCSITMP